ncbi:MAG: MBL fold metallo-hydrolase [Verrucomicrobiia bacterium]
MKRIFTSAMLLLCVLGIAAYAGDLCSTNMMVAKFGSPPPEIKNSNAKLEIEFLNVAQGDCIFLKLPQDADGHRTTILIDGGTTPKSPSLDAGSVGIAKSARTELNKWFSRENATLDYLIITHPDRDHYNIVPYIVGNLDVKKVIHIGETGDPNLDEGDNRYQGLWTPMLMADGTKKSGKHYNPTEGKKNVTMLDFLNQGRSPHHAPDVTRIEQERHDKLKPSNISLIPNSQVEFYVLAAHVPYGSGHTASNTGSIVLLLHYGNFEIILQGDGTMLTEMAMLDHYKDNSLAVEVLKVGHHGSNGSSSDPWLKKVTPRVGIISAGEDKGYGHPKKSVCTNLVVHVATNAPSHQFSWYPDGKKTQSFIQTRAAIFNTHDSHNILITTDGKELFWVQPGFSKN